MRWLFFSFHTFSFHSHLSYISVAPFYFPRLYYLTLRAHTQALAKLGYSELRVQYGHGQRPAVADDNGHGMRVVSFDFKPHLGEEMAAADLIIGHAGEKTTAHANALEAREGGRGTEKTFRKAERTGQERILRDLHTHPRLNHSKPMNTCNCSCLFPLPLSSFWRALS